MCIYPQATEANWYTRKLADFKLYFMYFLFLRPRDTSTDPHNNSRFVRQSVRVVVKQSGCLSARLVQRAHNVQHHV